MSTYIPDKHNIPNLEQAGDVEASLALNPLLHIDAAVNVSPFKSVFLGGKISRFYVNEYSVIAPSNPEGYDYYRFTEGWIGLYQVKKYKKTKLYYQLSYAFGKGSFEIRNAPSSFLIFYCPGSHLVGEFNRHAILASLTLDYLPVSFSFSTRIAKLKYYNIEGNLESENRAYYANFINSRPKHRYIEPAFTLGFKHNNVRFYGQLIFPVPKSWDKTITDEYPQLYAKYNLYGCLAYSF